MQPIDPHAAESGIRLSPLGEAYAIAHERPYGCPDGVDPHLWRQALESRAERHLSLATALIAMLDVMDGDPDLEPALAGLDGGPQDDRESDGLEHGEGDDADREPSLGWSDMEARYGAAPTFDPDRELDDADDEPSLGSPETPFAPPPYGMWRGQPPYLPAIPLGGQETWARGKGDDDEQTNEDGGDVQDEPHDEESDCEPSLGFTEHINQVTRARVISGWVFNDAEADYVDDRGRAHESDQEGVNEDGGDVLDAPHDEEPDREASIGVDAPDAGTTEWTPERSTEEYVGPGAKFTPVRTNKARRQHLREAGTGNQGHFHGLILNRMPARYIMQAEGDCLVPLLRNGGRIEVSSTDHASPGDLVLIYRFAQFVKPGEWQIVVKRLEWDARTGELTPVMFRDGKPVGLGHGVLASMLNPPRKLFYPVEQVEAVHKVVRILPEGERGIQMSAGEIAIMGLAQ